jgi:adenylate cyclase
VVAFLNELFAFMVDSVDRCGGFVNKFLGDGFMAVFGAPLALPNASASALAASREILSRLHEEIAQGGLPAVRVGIGLHSGEVLTGEVGSARRKEYTVIGDVVNVASRVEQLCKTHQCELLLTRPVYDAVRTEADNVFEHLGSDEVKGRTGQIEVFSIREAD